MVTHLFGNGVAGVIILFTRALIHILPGRGDIVPELLCTIAGAAIGAARTALQLVGFFSGYLFQVSADIRKIFAKLLQFFFQFSNAVVFCYGYLPWVY